MNTNKRLKPNLLDPAIPQKIIKTLNPPKPDYWAPTKSTFQNIYQNYIRPNFGLIIVIIIICLLLLYRYRVIKGDRENKQELKIEQPKVIVSNPQIDEYTNTIINAYNQQKEILREPPIKYVKNQKLNQNVGPKFAYPMYPYGAGGSLIPNASR